MTASSHCPNQPTILTVKAYKACCQPTRVESEGLVVGHVYRKLSVRGKTVVLRPMAWDDLDELLAFVNGLVDDKQRGRGSDVFTGFERKVTREEEADWLANRMVRIENRDMVSARAEVRRREVANGDIARGHYGGTRNRRGMRIRVTTVTRS